VDGEPPNTTRRNTAMTTIATTHVPFHNSATLAVADHEGSRFEDLLQGLEFLPGEGRRLAAVLRSFAARDGYYIGAELLPVADRDDLLVAQWGSAWGYFGRRSWEVEILLARDVTSYALNTEGGWEAGGRPALVAMTRAGRL